MSHASGAILFKDGDIKFYEYDGTADVILTQLYNSMREVQDSWRSGAMSECTCDEEEDVEIYTSYGYGSIYKGKACRKCMSVRGFYDEEGWLLNKIWEGTLKNNEPKWLKEYWLRRTQNEEG